MRDRANDGVFDRTVSHSITTSPMPPPYSELADGGVMRINEMRRRLPGRHP